MTNLYIAGNKVHSDVIIHAETKRDCENTFAQMCGSKDYESMEKRLGKEMAKVDSELMYTEDVPC